MPRVLSALGLLLALAANTFAQVDPRATFFLHRGGHGGTMDYAGDAWAWLDFRDSSYIYSDAAATVIAKPGDKVLAIRDKNNGIIWTNTYTNLTRDGQFHLQDGGGLYNSSGYSYIRSSENLFSYDDGIWTNDYAMVCVIDVQSTRSSAFTPIFSTSSQYGTKFDLGFLSTDGVSVWSGSRLYTTNTFTILDVPLGFHVFTLKHEYTGYSHTGTMSAKMDDLEIIRGNVGANASLFQVGFGSTTYKIIDGIWYEILVFDKLPENLDEIILSLMRKYKIKG